MSFFFFFNNLFKIICNLLLYDFIYLFLYINCCLTIKKNNNSKLKNREIKIKIYFINYALIIAKLLAIKINFFLNYKGRLGFFSIFF